jgi:hypothetical protein
MLYVFFSSFYFPTFLVHPPAGTHYPATTSTYHPDKRVQRHERGSDTQGQSVNNELDGGIVNHFWCENQINILL